MNWNARSGSMRRTYRNLSFEQLRALVLDGELNESDWVQREGYQTWTEIGAVTELADAIPAFTFRRDRATLEGDEDMDMTPMIDVVFQLLLFFMIISTFQIQKAIGFPNPGDPKEAKNIPTLGQLGRDRVILSISAQNDFELLHYDREGKAAVPEPVKREDLLRRLKKAVRNDRKTSLIIRADDKAKHESVVAAIDAANLADMEDIRIAQPVEAGTGPASTDTPVMPRDSAAPRVVEDK